MVNRGISEFPKNCLINTSIEASCKEKKKKKVGDLMNIIISTSKKSSTAIQIACLALQIPGTTHQFIISFVNYL